MGATLPVDWRVIMADMRKVIVCAPLAAERRATEMRALLRHVRPHGGNAAERVKQVRPNDRVVTTPELRQPR